MGGALKESTVAASVVADMLQYLERHGVAPAESMRACGIALQLPPQADDRVPGSQLERLWNFSVERLDDPLVGLHMAEQYNPGTLDILGYVILSCRTIGEVLDRFARYGPILNDGMRAELVNEGKSAFCRLTYVDSMDNYLLRDARHAVDATWTGVTRELGRLGETPLAASEVWVRHTPPNDDAGKEYLRVFGAPVRFGAPDDRVVFPVSHMDVPLRSANPALLQLFEQHADAVMSRLKSQGSRADLVVRVLATRMKGTLPTLGEVARELAMSERNLQRALRDDGTTFQKLVDDVRRDLAITHLSDPSTSAGQVGFLLGFSEPSAFHRAFRRWTGKAPSAYRGGLGAMPNAGRGAISGAA